MIPTERGVIKYDSLGLRVENIDDIFLPIASSGEIGIVSSQLQYFNFRARLLGTGEWNDLAELDQNRQYTNDVVFSTDSYVDEKDKEYQLFVGRYQRIMSKRPNPTALIGYDATKLLLDQIARGSSRRNDLAVALSDLKRVKGWHTTFTVGALRVNTAMTLLQFRDRSIRKIGETDLLEEQPQETIQQ
jgi:ABC-type branched-subunit amino acid transport system substrate-binding protein